MGDLYTSNFWSKFGHLGSYFSCNIGTPVEFSSIVSFLLTASKKSNTFLIKMSLTYGILLLLSCRLAWLNVLYVKLFSNEVFWIVPTLQLFYLYCNCSSITPCLTWFWCQFGIVNGEYFHRNQWNYQSCKTSLFFPNPQHSVNSHLHLLVGYCKLSEFLQIIFLCLFMKTCSITVYLSTQLLDDCYKSLLW